MKMNVETDGVALYVCHTKNFYSAVFQWNANAIQ